MAAAVEHALPRLVGRVQVKLLLGGVNTHSRLPVGQYGRRLLLKIWAEVAATTGAQFADQVPAGLVFNSLRACLFLRAFAEDRVQEPFALLHRMQQRLFVDGAAINEIPELARLADEFNWAVDSIPAILGDAALLARVRFDMAAARSHGTSALPSLLLEVAGDRRLLAGGYVDGPMICELVRTALEQQPSQISKN